MTDLKTLQEALGVSFADPSLLRQALVHTSYLNENPGFTRDSNEKLEFLGDAILGLIIAETLYRGYTQFSEGEMTRLRAALVRRETLARMAKAIGLGNFLYLGKGEEASGGRSKPSNLASSLEAVTAAIFLDRGLVATKDFILRLFDKEIQKVVSQDAVADYKSRLQELIQATQQSIPTYHLVEAVGPAHSQTFTAEVRVADTVLGSGSGKSKKMAETEAARAALKRLASNFTL